MKNSFHWRIAILSLFLSSLSLQNGYSQTSKEVPNVTPTMARKIALYCHNYPRAVALFIEGNEDIDPNRIDLAYRLLDKLDENLEYANNFIFALYYNYGVEMSYFSLKKAGFTIEEIDKAEIIWEIGWSKEKKKRQIKADKARKEREQNLLQRIERNDVFVKDVLSIQPVIELDIYNMETISVFNDRDERMDYEYDCIINKEGKLSLINLSDTLTYSTMQKFIYQFISDENMNAGLYKAGCIEIDGENLPVNSYVNIKFNEQRYKHKGYLNLTIKKNKKTGLWVILFDRSTDFMNWTCDEPERLKYDLEAAIYHCPKLQELKGEKKLKIDVYRRVLSSNFSSKIELSHYFKMSYRKDSFGSYGEYIPLEYPISF